MLTEMLNQSEAFQTLPLPQKTIFLTLANKFQSSTEYLFLDTDQLTEGTGLGTPRQWEEFLKLQETQNYMKTSMQFLSQIAQRKTFASLVSMALSGGQGAQQAAKQVQELSGIMNQADNNKTVILHHVPRPPHSKKEE